MPISPPQRERRQGVRSGLQVMHRHCVGSAVSERVSELVFVKGRPVALLEWINLGGIRTPLYICDLDPAKLREDEAQRGMFHYDGQTTDPRFASSSL